MLSAVLVVGSLRERGQAALDALCAQTALDRIEIILVDMAPTPAPPLRMSRTARLHRTASPRELGWGAARLSGLALATAPVVAFAEDHCHPDPGWAAALIEAHNGPWVAIGYGFRNGNPKTYVSRASMVSDYGLWMLPGVRGEAWVLPGNNVSYKRDALLSLGDKLPDAMVNDIVAQEFFRARGLPMFVEPGAVAAHFNFESLAVCGRANHAWGRVMASRRAGAMRWSRRRRIAWGLLTPLGEPPVYLARILRTARRRPGFGRALLAALPLLAVVRVYAATSARPRLPFRPGRQRGAHDQVRGRRRSLTGLD